MFRIMAQSLDYLINTVGEVYQLLICWRLPHEAALDQLAYKRK
jgi:hypothetical protein